MRNETNFMELEKNEKKMQIVPDYRKKSFYEGCTSFEDSFNRMSECGFSYDLLSLVSSFQEKDTQAFKYNNTLITPCMVDGMLDTVKADYKLNDIKAISKNIIDTLKSGYSLHECEELVNLNLI